MGRLVELHKPEIPAAAYIARGLVVHHDLVDRALLLPVPIVVEGVLQGVEAVPVAAQDHVHVGALRYHLLPALFARFPTLESFAEAKQEDVEEMIHSCGFYHGKARDLIGSAQMLLRDYGGVVPDTMEELLKLPGVGRKTANLVLGDIYKQPAVVTDTHCIRIAGRLGLTKNKEPVKVERDLRKILPPEKSSDFCHRMVLHGRKYCMARKPDCEHCPLTGICKKVL